MATTKEIKTLFECSTPELVEMLIELYDHLMLTRFRLDEDDNRKSWPNVAQTYDESRNMLQTLGGVYARLEREDR